MKNEFKPLEWEDWAEKNAYWLALVIVAAGFAVRLFYVESCYLNPDEAAHFELARPSSWRLVYEAAMSITHPPLLILTLHGILSLGRTELVLRIPSLVAGTAALWLTFAWMRMKLGALPALAGLEFMTFCPLALSASTEARQYGLLLFFLCGALYATERALNEISPQWTVIQGLFLLGAVLSHYTAVVVIASLGLYVLFRTFLERMPRRILLIFVASYLALMGVSGWLYLKEVGGLVAYRPGAGVDYLQYAYFAAGRETPIRFALRAFQSTFSYAAGFGRSFVLAFAAGLVYLMSGRAKTGRLMALLIGCTFLLGFACAVVRVFPFAGTRHQTYLAPFFAMAISAAFAFVPRRVRAPCLLLMTVLVPFWTLRVSPDNNPRNQASSDMTASLRYMNERIQRGSGIFTDDQTRYILRFYLGKDETSLDTWPQNPSNEGEWLGGYQVFVPKGYVWVFRTEDILNRVNQEAAKANSTGRRLWFVTASWRAAPPEFPVSENSPCEAKRFGQISVIDCITQ